MIIRQRATVKRSFTIPDPHSPPARAGKLFPPPASDGGLPGWQEAPHDPGVSPDAKANPTRIRIFSVDNHPLFCEGIATIIKGAPDMALVSLVIMDVWQITPFFMLVILAGLQSIDENTVAAARVDGAGPLQMFRFILLPHLVPYMLIAASFRIIASMGDFDKIYLLTGGGPGNATTLMMLSPTILIAFSRWAMMSAASGCSSKLWLWNASILFQ